ncbi:RNA-binding protein MEX3B-like isoform X1 [Mytilus edulis]|uniref:RNA-binding protein MEX3B-like isoform X1 n=1 Tax=Mytilus edulis TaxID=6550 RepID=UPI0039F14BE5
MPANLFTETLPVNTNLEEQRALHLAFELSMLGLDEDNNSSNMNDLSESAAELLKKNNGANTTECVPVPSSEHVAEIVGRQGCKIKALRAKTNTYIKTPVRGEEPVFVVTGRKEDVNLAKREILSAAEHFSQIRASRRNSSVSSNGPPSPSAPGQVTIQVRVPYKVVGLVVGPKGATIKRIQQQTHTYIVTPSRDKEPVFEVTGLAENVDKAKIEIESHIAIRTGGQIEGQDDDFHNNGIDSGFQEMNGNNFLAFKSMNGFNSFTDYQNTLNGSKLMSQSSVFNFPPVSKISDFAPLTMNTGFTNGFGMYDNDEGFGGSPQFDQMPPSNSIWPDSLTGLGGSSFQRRCSSLGSAASQHSLSPPLTDSNSQSSGQNSPPVSDLVRHMNGDFIPSSTTTVSTAFGNITTTASYAPSSCDQDMMSSDSISASIINSVVDSPKMIGGISCPVKVPTLNGRQCLMCSESNIVAALVPCGHNLFCMECASLIVGKPVMDRLCPVCLQTPTQAIRILS